MDGQDFDRLTKRLAEAPSRRHVIKGFSGAVAATLLAAVGRQRHAVAHRGNDACAHFCTSVFAAGRACGACISDAARGVGLCAVCDADLDRVMTAEDGTLFCDCEDAADPCGGICCTDDQFCDTESDSCVACREAGADCEFESQCCSGICHPYEHFCVALPS